MSYHRKKFPKNLFEKSQIFQIITNSHLKALSSPTPVFALVLKIAQGLFLILHNLIDSEFFISDIAPSMPCLLAKIAIGVPCNSSSFTNINNSLLAISNLIYLYQLNQLQKLLHQFFRNSISNKV